VTFEERDGKAQVVVRDLYPSKEALAAAIASESTAGFTEQFEQLDELLVPGRGTAGIPFRTIQRKRFLFPNRQYFDC
jgi:hypothetical protein